MLYDNVAACLGGLGFVPVFSARFSQCSVEGGIALRLIFFSRGPASLYADDSRIVV